MGQGLFKIIENGAVR